MEFTPAVIEDLIYLAAALYAAIKFGSNSIGSLLNRWLDKKMDPMKGNFDSIKDILDKSMVPEMKKAQTMTTYFDNLNKRHDEMELAEPLVSCPRCVELDLGKPDADCPDCEGKGYVPLQKRAIHNSQRTHEKMENTKPCQCVGKSYPFSEVGQPHKGCEECGGFGWVHDEFGGGK